MNFSVVRIGVRSVGWLNLLTYLQTGLKYTFRSSLGVNYHDLCRPQQNVVKESMPLVFGNEFDGGVDHSNVNFQNMLAYIGGFFLIGCDRFFLNRCCPGKV